MGGFKGFKGFKGDQGEKGFKGVKGFKGFKGAKGHKGFHGVNATNYPTPAPTPIPPNCSSDAAALETCAACKAARVARNESADAGVYHLKELLPFLPEPTYHYIGRFHGSAFNDGTGGYGNEMRPISAIWDHDDSTAASASISGWSVTKSTNPAGIQFNFATKQNYKAKIHYGVNGYHQAGELRIYVDGILAQTRHFDLVTEYTDIDEYTIDIDHFQSIKFMLRPANGADLRGLGPHPNFKIYEIYPSNNIAGTPGQYDADQEHCSQDELNPNP